MKKQYRLIIFDVDGTLTTTKSGATFRKCAADWQLLPGRREKCKELREQGIRLSAATNQGGVAFGYLERDLMMLELMNLAIDLGLEGNQVCFEHPTATVEKYRNDSYNRKPKPGMLFKAMEFHHVFPADTLMVGDRPEDEGAAKAAGIDFLWAKDFFGDEEVVDDAGSPF